MKKTVGILFADTMEYGPFLQWAKENVHCEKIRRGNESCSVTLTKGENSLEVIAVRCGIGKVNAASATAFLISDDNADYILNAGLSGAVQKLKREDMIAAESFVECDFDLTAIGYGLGVKPDGQEYIYYPDEKLLSYALMSKGIIKAKTGTGDIFLTDKERKNLYKETFGIDSFDMETAAIAGVCHKCGVPMLSLRKISDDADDCSVEDYREMNERQESCLTELLINVLSRILDDME
ncbi:MAG: 5'-methylthioadenosine/S-adenosylhomocysteine nucleosidase [Clostridia bacterium]|nr:5'-methylthioadenosine/S-adenosylhomocysteine nucleosidase [Clostridia bacterium]